MSGRLPDGTAYAGTIGEVAYDPDSDTVQCHLCGQWLKRIGGMHLKQRHGWTIRRYRTTFQLTESVIAAGTRSRLRNNAIQRLKDRTLGSPLADGLGLQQAEWQPLADTHPQLRAEWHPTRNEPVDASMIGRWSQQRVWWRCTACGHEWRTTVASRAGADGHCPVCGPRAQTPTGGRGHPRGPRRSIAVLRPDLAGELHPTLNGGVDAHTIGLWSKQPLWWSCPTCEHAWQTRPANRAQGTGCPKCAAHTRTATYERNRIRTTNAPD